MNSTAQTLDISKGLFVEGCNVMATDDVLQKCTTENTLYHFGQNQKGFDSFIFPNIFLQITHTSKRTGNHPLLFSTVSECCMKAKGGANFVMVVTESHIDKWRKSQSFKINDDFAVEEIRRFEKKSRGKQLIKGGRRTYSKLPQSLKDMLPGFRLYVGGIKHRTYSTLATSACRNLPILMKMLK